VIAATVQTGIFSFMPWDDNDPSNPYYVNPRSRGTPRDNVIGLLVLVALLSLLGNLCKTGGCVLAHDLPWRVRGGIFGFCAVVVWILSRRNTREQAEAARSKPLEWMVKVNVGGVAAMTLDDGERLTAEVRDFNDANHVLSVDVVSSNRALPSSSQPSRAIPIRHVVSFEPRPRAEQPWPYSDPCRAPSFSRARFVLMATLFLCLTVGSLPLFYFLTNRPYGLQAASAIAYTIFEVFFTFANTRGFPPYMFTCPAVRTQVSRLIWLHLGFLVALIAMQTLVLAVRPNLPDWWNTDGGSPFELALILLCGGLGYAQVFTNRRLLDRAHREFSS
jgi:hypothetical protein